MSKEINIILPIKVSDNEKYCSKDCYFIDAYHNNDYKLVWCCTAFEEDKDHHQTLVIVESPKKNEHIKIPRCEQCKKSTHKKMGENILWD